MALRAFDIGQLALSCPMLDPISMSTIFFNNLNFEALLAFSFFVSV